MELFKLFGEIAIDNSRANQALEETASQAGSSSNEVSSAVNKIGSVAATIAKGIATASVAIGGAWLLAIEGSREYRKEMGLLDTAFIVQGHSSEVAKNTYSDLNAVLGDTGQAVEAAQHLSMLADNEKDLQTWTDICTGVYATFGASLPIESLAESSQEVSRSGELTGGLVDALVWAGISEEEFQAKLDECSTEQERQNLIMNTLNGTYKKASDQYKETNKDVMDANRANEALSDAFAELGRIGEPILTSIKEKVAEMVNAAVPHLENFIQKIKDVKQWIEDNQTTIDIWVATIIGAGVSIGIFLLILNWGTIMKAAANAVNTVRLAILALNTAIKANPIGFLISLIIGLIAYFIYLWQTNEDFRKFWIDMWEKVKSACGSAVQWIKDKFSNLKDVVSGVKETFGKIKDAISEKIEGARESVKTALDKIKGFFPLNIGKIFSNFSIPKITVNGGKAPYGIAGKGTLPSFDVKWNAEGGILTEPTIFGLTTTGQLLGGGESGDEAIAPISKLQDYIQAAVQKDNEILGKIMIEQNRIMMDFLARTVPSVVRLDSGALVGALVPGIDMKLSNRMDQSRRGNTA